jgi:competence protein ComEC
MFMTGLGSKSRSIRLLAAVLLILLPLYLWRLRQVPVYRIPEDKTVKVTGWITRQPYLKGSNQIINVGPITVKTDRFPRYFYGQKISLSGNFTRRLTTGDYPQYYSSYPSIIFLAGSGKGGLVDRLTGVLLSLREKFSRTLGKFFPEPHASLLMGIIFGVKSQLPPEFWDKLQQTGTLHVVVASGQNVSIVARILLAVLVLAVNRRVAVFLAGLGVAAYILMAGAEPPLVRAGIMATVGYAAQLFGRQEEGTVALLLAVVIMLIVSPLVLFDVGFQLSLAATAGIIWVYPLIRRGIILKLGFFGEALAATLAAQVGVTPLLINYFGQVSLLSPLVNGLILWMVPLLMILGITIVGLGLVFRPLAVGLSWFVWALASLFIGVIELFGGLPGANLSIGPLPSVVFPGYYLLIGALVAFVLQYDRNKTA